MSNFFKKLSNTVSDNLTRLGKDFSYIADSDNIGKLGRQAAAPAGAVAGGLIGGPTGAAVGGNIGAQLSTAGLPKPADAQPTGPVLTPANAHPTIGGIVTRTIVPIAKNVIAQNPSAAMAGIAPTTTTPLNAGFFGDLKKPAGDTQTILYYVAGGVLIFFLFGFVLLRRLGR